MLYSYLLMAGILTRIPGVISGGPGWRAGKVSRRNPVLSGKVSGPHAGLSGKVVKPVLGRRLVV